MRTPIRTVLAVSAAVALAGTLLVTPGAAASRARPAHDAPAAAWTYLAMGDSNVYGPAEVCGGCTAYPALLQDAIPARTGHPVTLLDASQWNRLTVAKLLDEIRSDDWGGSSGAEPWSRLPDASPSPRTAIAAADIITIQVGFNDLPWLDWADPCSSTFDQVCEDQVIPRMVADLDAILDEVDTLRAGRPTAVRVANLFNDVIPGGYDNSQFYSPEVIVQGRTGVKSFVDRLSAAMCRVARQHRAVCLDLYTLFNGRSHRKPVAVGIFTPEFGDMNQPGQDLIAEELLDLGLRPLTRHHRHGG